MATFKHYAVSPQSAVIVFYGDLDVSGCQGIEGPLWGIIEHYPGQIIVLDFTYVNHLSSYGVGLLVEAFGTVTEFGGRMSISNPRPNVYESLYLNGADLVIPIYDSYKTALADSQWH